MKLKIIFVALLLLSFPLVLSYSFGGTGGYYNDPMYYLQNPWVLFIIYFIFFFAIIYLTTNKSFRNPPVSAVVAGALSLFIAMALGQRGYLDYYMSTGVASWALLIAALIAIGFSIKFSYETFGRIGAIAAILLTWFILRGLSPEEIFPYELLRDPFLEVYYFFTSIIGLIILIVISAIIIVSRSHRRGSYLRNAIDELFGR